MLQPMDAPGNAPLHDQKTKLMRQVDEFLQTYEKRHGTNYYIHHGLIVGGIAVGAALAISGILGYPIAAAILGVISSAIFAMDATWALGELAEFQRIVAGKARNMLSELEFVQSEEQFHALRRSFYALREHADQSLPRGSGMEAVKRMYEDVNSKLQPQ